MAKAVRLADIAKIVGVSTVTVSKALSGQKGVSEEMREKIKALADEMGYVQPSVERRREEIKSYNIGVLIEESYLDKYASFYWQMYQQVNRMAMERECYTLLEVVNEHMEETLEMPRLVDESKADGLMIIGKLPEDYLQMLREQANIPLIYLDFTDEKRNTDAVVSDSFYGSYYLTNYLIENGHTRIAFVGTLLATSSITDRYLGYSKALMEHGQPYRSDWVINDRYLHNGYIDEENLIQFPEDMPTAFFCNCDLTAGKLINKLKKHGYRVPEDISVVGYDNYIYPGICDVGITTYEVDQKEMARKATSILVKKMRGDSTSEGIHIVEGHLVEKDSVRNIK